MTDKELVERLNAYSAQYQNHGGITAEAADRIEQLRAELTNERIDNTNLIGELATVAAERDRYKAERENPQPLTLEELRRMDGQPVWVTFLDDVFTIGHTAPLWMIVNAEEKEFQAKNEYVCFSDIGCIAYPSKPKGRE
jgi:hypothetical protein|uniref:Uncharacterized protein n=1 Tax=Siphoviridae sp. ctGdK3 TaxID=2826222 RepID=A0A8S5MVH8_9CAUD|nr:MAG TPA: hypothetical protein [Siphoviridae sp. ctGdK3]